MNVLVIGCGRIGSSLAMTLVERGHDVAVVDKNEMRIEALKNDGFEGAVLCGVPIDDDVLRKAGITSCDAVCAVTDEDNVNIMAAQLAKEIYNIPFVVARVLDIEKEGIYQECGINTLCPTNLTVDSILSVIDDVNNEKLLHFGVHTVKFYIIDVPEDFIGEKAVNIELEENEILFGIMKADGTMKLMNNYNVVIEHGDKLVFSKKID